MLHIVLVVLKILGMVLLGIVGILLSILLAVLLIPVRYRAEGSYYGTVKLHIHVTWFLHLITIIFQYGEEKILRIKILGIDLQRIGNRRKRKKAAPVETSGDKKPENKKPENKRDADKEDEESAALTNRDRKTAFKKSVKSKWSKKPKLSLSLGQAKAKKEKTVETVRAFWYQLKGFNRIAFAVIKKEIFYLLRHIRPRKFRMRLHYGMEDPSTTGIILAALCALYPFYAETLQIQPDFENKVLEGDGKLKGHLRGIHVIVSMFRIVINKECRALYRQLTHK